MLHFIRCGLVLLLSVGWTASVHAESPFSAEHLQQVLNQPEKPSPQVQTIHQLGAWFEQGKITNIQAWIKQHPKEAQTLGTEFYIDVHASPWLGIPPQYPHSPELLPIFAKELHQPAWTAAPCSDKQMRNFADECKGTAWKYELMVLSNEHQFMEDLRLYRLPFNFGMVGYEFHDNDAIVTVRGLTQVLYARGLTGNLSVKRLINLAEGLIKAKLIGATHLETLFLLALAETLAEWDGKSTEDQPQVLITEKVKTELIQACVDMAHRQSQTLKSERLAAEVLQIQAFVTPGNSQQHFAKAEQTIQKLPHTMIQEVLLLKLADSLMIHGHSVEPRYCKLFFEGEYQRSRALERLLRSEDADTIADLQQHYPRESDISIKAALTEAFVAGNNALPLIDMYKEADDAELRQALVKNLAQALYKELTEADYINTTFGNSHVPAPSPIGTFLWTLANDPDPEIRKTITRTFGHSLDPKTQQQVLAWSKSPHPELQAAALSLAMELKRSDYLGTALQTVSSPDSQLQEISVQAISAWGSTTHIPLLQKLLPHHKKHVDTDIHMAIARLQGSEELLQEAGNHLMEDKSGWVKYRLEQAIRQEVILPSAFLIWLKDFDTDTQVWGLMALEIPNASGDPNLPLKETPKELKHFLDSSHQEVQATAIHLLVPGPVAKAYVPQLVQTLHGPLIRHTNAYLNKLAQLDFTAFVQVLPRFKGTYLDPQTLLAVIQYHSNAQQNQEHRKHLQELADTWPESPFKQQLQEWLNQR